MWQLNTISSSYTNTETISVKSKSVLCMVVNIARLTFLIERVQNEQIWYSRHYLFWNLRSQNVIRFKVKSKSVSYIILWKWKQFHDQIWPLAFFEIFSNTGKNLKWLVWFITNLQSKNTSVINTSSQHTEHEWMWLNIKLFMPDY